MKKYFKIFGWSTLVLVLSLVGFVAIKLTPIMASFTAKTVCSCLYVAGKNLESVRAKELQVYPFISNADIELLPDSSVTARILWQKNKAIYRKGLGCTLLFEQPEEVVRKQKFNLAGSPTINQDTVLWPAGNVLKENSFNIDHEKLNKAVEGAFIETEIMQPLNTDAVIVVYNGEIIAEKYAKGFDKNSKLLGWSMTKSIVNAFIGILVRDGKISVNDFAPIPEWQQDDRKNIRIENLLQATSGLRWNESYFNPLSDFHMMFTYRDDKAKFEASRELNYTPGEHFQYSSSSTNILSGITRQIVGDNDYTKFPYERLFYKIGMNSAVLEPDASGTFIGSSYCYATARDWARFGLLYLNDGYWLGERILPEGWVEYSMTPSVAAPLGEYGAQWWLNVGKKGNPEQRRYPTLPEDAFCAEGFEEQYVMVIPSENLVVVRLGVSHHGFPFDKMVADIISSLPED